MNRLSSLTIARRGRPVKYALDLSAFHCPFCGAVDGLKVHSAYGKTERRYRLKCTDCGKTFSERRGTAMFRAKKSVQDVAGIAQALCDGNGIRGAARVCKVNRITIARYLAKAGVHASKLAKHRLKDLTLREVQTDELETHVFKKKKNVSEKDRALHPDAGKAWVVASVDAETKLMPLVRVFPEFKETAMQNYVKGLAELVKPWPLFATDQRPGYENILTEATQGKALYVQAAGHAPLPAWKERPKPRIAVGDKEAVAKHYAESTASNKINTSFIEHLFKTIRTANRRLQRKVNGISKKRTALQCQLSLFAAYYNFVKVHRSLNLPNGHHGDGRKWERRTPAMAAGLAARPWTVEELITARV